MHALHISSEIPVSSLEEQSAWVHTIPACHVIYSIREYVVCKI